MRIYLFLFYLSFTQIGICQFEVFERERKVGFSYNKTILKKAKYDSVHIGDPRIITAYKRNKAYYFNQKGEKTHGGPISQVLDFTAGTGIISNLRNQYALIDTSGHFLREYKASEPPKRYGKFICFNEKHIHKYKVTKRVDTFTHSYLYNHKGKVEGNFDSIYTYDNWLITVNSPRQYRPEESIVYDTKTGVLIENEVLKVVHKENLIHLTKTDKSLSLYAPKNNHLIKGVTSFEKIDHNYFYCMWKHKRTLFKTATLTPLIQGDFTSFELKNSTIHALNAFNGEYPALSTYNYEGKLLTSGINYVKNLQDGRYIYQKNEKQYIGTENGTQLSKLYTGFGPAKNGYRIVYEKFMYSYINDITYKKLDFNYPVIGRKKSTYPSKNNVLLDLFIGLSNVFHGNSNPTYDPNAINILAPSDGFNESYAIVCLYKANEKYGPDTLTLVTTDSILFYNFVDTNGHYFNSKQYTKCHPFYNGSAWVVQNDEYQLIAKNGKPTNGFKFDKVTRDERGFYITENEYLSLFFGFREIDRGLISPDFKEISPCKYNHIIYENGKYYGDYGGEKRYLLYDTNL